MSRAGMKFRTIETLFAILIVFLVSCPDIEAWVGPSAKAAVAVIKPLINHSRALPEEEVVRLAQLGRKTGGTKEIGQQLGKMRLPTAVLEDTYMRVAIQQSKISRTEAEGMIFHLHGVPGFQTTLRKIVGNSDIKTAGHLNELRIADQASQNGFRVKGIGMSFVDANKASPTDIDIILKRKDKVFAIEAKDYLSTTPIPLDKFRADMVTLNEYAMQNSGVRVVKVFTITNQPNDELTKKLLFKEAQRHEIELIYGSPEMQVLQLQQLEKIL